MLTVVVATYNGSYTLPRCLSTCSRLVTPDGGWKMVVVDNGSSDETRNIVYSFTRRLPITYVFERCLGKSVALNSALSLVEGDLIVFTDDDVLPKRDWLVKMRRVADSQPSYSIFGGSIVPHWEVSPPNWVLTQVPLGPVFGVTDPLLADGPIQPGAVFGANMAIRSERFVEGHRFNANIGPRGRKYAMGSETDLLLRLANAGNRAWHCSEAVVGHIIRKFQLDQNWILERAQNFGREQYRLRIRHEYPHTKFLMGVPRWLIRQMVKEALRAGYATSTRNSAESFPACWRFNYLKGQAKEARNLRAERASTAGLEPHFSKRRLIDFNSRGCEFPLDK